MNIPSDEVLAEAVKYANEVTGQIPDRSDMKDARDALAADPCGSWTNAIHKFVKQVDDMSKAKGAWLVEVDENGIPSLAFDAYQRSAMSLAFYPERGTGDLSYPAHGLSGESTETMAKVLASFAAGDDHATAPALMATILACVSAGRVSEHVKKAMRDDGGKLTEARKQSIKKELGDVLWYVCACATEAGFSLREVAEANLTKVNDRAARGKLGGSGDER